MSARTRDILIALAAGLALLAGDVLAGTTTLTLRSVVRTATPESLRIGDVARIEGPERDALAAIPIPPAGDDPITLEHLRSVILGSGLLREDQLALRGRVCRLVTVEQKEQRAPPPATAPTPTEPQRPAVDTVIDRVRAHLAASLRVAPQDVRLTPTDRDREDLHRPVAGLRVEVRTTGFSRRMPVAIDLYEGDRRVWHGTPRVGVEIRRSVATASAPLARGALLGESDLIASQRWLAPDDDALPIETALGQRLRSRIDPGEAVRWRDVERPTLVERGDIVMVRSAVGAASVRLRARARADAFEGETIEFETVGPRGTTRVVRATVTGPGRAVLTSEESE